MTTTIEIEVTIKKARRGTTNRNDRGSSEGRRRRRQWLVETYRADVDAWVIRYEDGMEIVRPYTKPLADETRPGMGRREPACRCFRCGTLLIESTVTADRIKPGCEGGSYRRENIRPCCGSCNSITEARLGNQRRKASMKSSRR